MVKILILYLLSRCARTSKTRWYVSDLWPPTRSRTSTCSTRPAKRESFLTCIQYTKLKDRIIAAHLKETFEISARRSRFLDHFIIHSLSFPFWFVQFKKLNQFSKTWLKNCFFPRYLIIDFIYVFKYVEIWSFARTCDIYRLWSLSNGTNFELYFEKKRSNGFERFTHCIDIGNVFGLNVCECSLIKFLSLSFLYYILSMYL